MENLFILVCVFKTQRVAMKNPVLSEIGGERLQAGRWARLGVEGWKLEAGVWRLDARGWGLEAARWRLEAGG